MQFDRARRLGLLVRALAIFWAATTLTIDAREASASYSYRVAPLVRAGDPAPGTGAAFGKSGLGSNPWIGDTDAGGPGCFVFSATLLNGASSIYEVRDGELLLLRSTGDPAPGGVYVSFRSVSMATDGSVAFLAEVFGVGDRLLLMGEGADEVIATIGDVAPGGGTFIWFHEISVNTSGDLLFKASVSGGSESSGLFLASAGNISGVALSTPYYGGPKFFALNDAGDIAFGGWDAVGPMVVSIKGGIPTIIVRDETVAPGTGGDSHLTLYQEGFIGVSLAEDGRINYVSLLESCIKDEMFQYYCAVFQWDGITTRLIMRDGQSIPQGGGTFYQVYYTSAGESGDVAFQATNFAVPGGTYVERGGRLVDAAHKSYMPELWQFTSQFSDPQLSPSHEILFTLTGGPGGQALYLARPISTLVPSLSPLAGALLAVALCAAAGWVLANRELHRSSSASRRVELDGAGSIKSPPAVPTIC